MNPAGIAAPAHRKLTEVKQTITDLRSRAAQGSVRDDRTPGLRAIPTGRKAVVAFTVDDTSKELLGRRSRTEAPTASAALVPGADRTPKAVSHVTLPSESGTSDRESMLR